MSRLLLGLLVAATLAFSASSASAQGRHVESVWGSPFHFLVSWNGDRAPTVLLVQGDPNQDGTFAPGHPLKGEQVADAWVFSLPKDGTDAWIDRFVMDTKTQSIIGVRPIRRASFPSAERIVFAEDGVPKRSPTVFASGTVMGYLYRYELGTSWQCGSGRYMNEGCTDAMRAAIRELVERKFPSKPKGAP